MSTTRKGCWSISPRTWPPKAKSGSRRAAATTSSSTRKFMKTTAKYLFDEDFATGGKPTITVVEAERRRADAESQAHRKGFAAGQAQAQGEINQRIAAALAVIADGIDKLNR